jgi:hypothetical protein
MVRKKAGVRTVNNFEYQNKIYMFLPSSHFFYNYLKFRNELMTHLDHVLEYWLERRSEPLDWKKIQEKRKSKFVDLLRTLEMPLEDAVDDTPVESFLLAAKEQFESYEREFLANVLLAIKKKEYLELIIQECTFWGRKLAEQYWLESDIYEILEIKSAEASLYALFEKINLILRGGSLSGEPFLLRRATDSELEYEFRSFPTFWTSLSTGEKELWITIDEALFEGFLQKVSQKNMLSFVRKYSETSCVDLIQKNY